MKFLADTVRAQHANINVQRSTRGEMGGEKEAHEETWSVCIGSIIIITDDVIFKHNKVLVYITNFLGESASWESEEGRKAKRKE